MSFFYLFFSLDGRISRKYFWLGLAALIAVSIFLTLIVGILMGVKLEAFADSSNPQITLIDLIVNLIVLYPNLAVTAKRLHDRGRSMLLGIILTVLSLSLSALELLGLSGTPEEPSMMLFIIAAPFAIIAIWLLIELGFLRGTKGENRYGPDPLAHLAQQEA